MSEASRHFESAAAALNQYFVGSQTLGESLRRVAELSIDALPQTSEVGITLLVDGKLKTSVFTHPEVADIDQAQYRTGHGPCVDAYHEGKTKLIDSTLQPGEWQAFRDSAAQHGVLSTMSLPLTAPNGPFGALNMYAQKERAYGEDDRRVGELFAAQAGLLLANAQAYWDARELSENLEQAMVSRATIEQAKGVIMANMGCSPQEAIEVLIQQSQQQNIKLRDLAVEIVRNVSRRRPLS
jgi:GAF domain-containing protein